MISAGALATLTMFLMVKSKHDVEDIAPRQPQGTSRVGEPNTTGASNANEDSPSCYGEAMVLRGNRESGSYDQQSLLNEQTIGDDDGNALYPADVLKVCCKIVMLCAHASGLDQFQDHYW